MPALRFATTKRNVHSRGVSRDYALSSIVVGVVGLLVIPRGRDFPALRPCS